VPAGSRAIRSFWAPSNLRGTRTRVVIVEDNRLFRETLELLLDLWDEIEVVGSVEGGEEAVELCRRVTPDAVLMDYRMPGLDGAQATAAVLEASPASRVVCLTASVSAEERERVLAAGAVACVTKDEGLDRIVGAILEVE
jgi:two-component system NarL family response regulator